ncbi:hypothetical protein HBH98_206000 [Parastagonospora nodorum]|nr:hypothetical protein HBH53_197700 [Parastagonospora nodorum]KAH3966805.1 hypothetical protein HBH52_194470 [Parastagonospora nodorum]KAH4076198.1 hypothetical protein HBH50_001860 [Parastagonospora nodorum]KAH4081772.1 hypothetical protein HBH48_193170 [Parastagonospora nodorum]KAH4092693.1 hypothetical protein HBH46_180810 [Parastagonospora nodorum]
MCSSNVISSVQYLRTNTVATVGGLKLSKHSSLTWCRPRPASPGGSGFDNQSPTFL